MNITKDNLLLYAITDRSWLNGEPLTAQVEAILSAGATCLQVREKHLAYDAFLSEVQTLLPICRAHGVPLIVNDNVALAKEADADGVHVGQEDMAVRRARELLGPDKIIGTSAHNVAEAERAWRDGADYLGCGAVFGSSTKDNVTVLDRETLAAICRAVPLPIVAIGGITRENITRLAGTGIHGVALISALFAAPDKRAATEEMLALSRQITGRNRL